LDDIKRLNIWRALSELFLDTEIDNVTYHYILRTLSENNCSLVEAEKILWREVCPVLKINLNCITGVWDGWPDSWLLENLSNSDKTNAPHAKPIIVKQIQQHWTIISELSSRR